MIAATARRWLGNVSIRQKLIAIVVFSPLSNAARFTQQGRVGLDVVPRSIAGEEWIDFAVSDTGIGLAPDQRERLFQSFTADDRARLNGTSGGSSGRARSRARNSPPSSAARSRWADAPRPAPARRAHA